MKKFKNFIICFILIIPIFLFGCKNPFGGNSLGNTSTGSSVESEATPGQKDDSTPKQEEEEEVVPTYYDPTHDEEGKYSSITDAFSSTKLVYKPSDSISNASEVRLTIEQAAKIFLARAVAEYGVGNVNITRAALRTEDNPIYVKPFNTLTENTLYNVGLTTSVANYPDLVMDNFANYMVNAKKMFRINAKTEENAATEKYYAIISTTEFATLPFKIVYKEAAEIAIGQNRAAGYYIEAASGVEVNGILKFEDYFGEDITMSSIEPLSGISSQFSVIATSSGGHTSYHIFIFDKPAFTNDFANNLKKLVDTHIDGVRKNLEGVSGDDEYGYTFDWREWNKTINAITYLPEEYVKAYVDLYGQEFAVDIAALQMFGMNKSREIAVPAVSAPSAYHSSDMLEFYRDAIDDASTSGPIYQKFMEFSSLNIDHNGFTTYEADVIAEFFMEKYIGDRVIDADEARYTSNTIGTPKQNEVKSFNSNEAVEDGNTILKYRKLITDYNNFATRASSKNDIFDSINYSDTVLADVEGATDFLKYGTKYDSRSNLFKNYTNTSYASVYYMQSAYDVGVTVEYIDVDTDYLMNVSFNEDIAAVDAAADEDEEDVEEDEELEGEEDGAEAVFDPYLKGKVQSIVLMPDKAVEVHYIELLIEPDIALLNLAQEESIKVKPVMRYCKGGVVYVCDNLLIDGAYELDLKALLDEGKYVADASSIIYGSGDFFTFVDPSNNKKSDLILSPGQFTNRTPTNPRKLNIFQVGKEKVENSPHFKVSEYSHGKGVTYVYNDVSTDFIEISFVVTLNGSNYSGTYGLGVMLGDIYGKVL